MSFLFLSIIHPLLYIYRSVNRVSQRCLNHFPTQTIFLLKPFSFSPIFVSMIFLFGYYETIAVCFQNLPEKPKNMEVYGKVVSQLRPVLEQLKDKNSHLQLPQKYRCFQCKFKTESLLTLRSHQQYPHFKHNKWVCCFCDEFTSRENDAMKEHYRSDW